MIEAHRAALARLTACQAGLAEQARARIARLTAIEGLEVLCDHRPEARGTWPVLLLRLRDPAQRDRLLAISNSPWLDDPRFSRLLALLQPGRHD